MTETMSSPRNGGRPQSISYITAPSAYRSERGSGSRPSACSGARYATVPSTVPSVVMRLASTFAASPKSPSRAAPSWSSHTFSGLRSRCTIDSACACIERASELLGQRQRPLHRQAAGSAQPRDAR